MRTEDSVYKRAEHQTQRRAGEGRECKPLRQAVDQRDLMLGVLWGAGAAYLCRAARALPSAFSNGTLTSKTGGLDQGAEDASLDTLYSKCWLRRYVAADQYIFPSL